MSVGSALQDLTSFVNNKNEELEQGGGKGSVQQRVAQKEHSTAREVPIPKEIHDWGGGNDQMKEEDEAWIRRSSVIPEVSVAEIREAQLADEIIGPVLKWKLRVWARKT